MFVLSVRSCLLYLVLGWDEKCGSEKLFLRIGVGWGGGFNRGPDAVEAVDDVPQFVNRLREGFQLSAEGHERGPFAFQSVHLDAEVFELPLRLRKTALERFALGGGSPENPDVRGERDE